jgi:hypothetical protein
METEELNITNKMNIYNLIENKFDSFNRNINYDCIWNKFKIATLILIKKHPEYIKGPHNVNKLLEITGHIWNEGIKLMPDQYQLIINMDPVSHMNMYTDIHNIIDELSNPNKF